MMARLSDYYRIACVYCEAPIGVVQKGNQPRRTICDDTGCINRLRRESA